MSSMMKRSLEDICEEAVIDLEAANKMLSAMWDEHFGWINKPNHWDNDFHLISAQVTAYKILMDHITELLLTAYGMAPEHCAADFKLLYEESKQAWPESEVETA